MILSSLIGRSCNCNYPVNHFKVNAISDKRASRLNQCLLKIQLERCYNHDVRIIIDGKIIMRRPNYSVLQTQYITFHFLQYNLQYLMVWAVSPFAPHSGQLYVRRKGQVTFPSASFRQWEVYSPTLSPLLQQNTQTGVFFACCEDNFVFRPRCRGGEGGRGFVLRSEKERLKLSLSSKIGGCS